MSLIKTHLIVIIILISFVSSCTKSSDAPVSTDIPKDTAQKVLNDLVYAGTTQGSVCAYNAADGKIKWSTNLFAGSLNLGFNSSPTLVNGVVYIGSPLHKIVALDAATGSIKWSCLIDSYSDFFFCSPLVINDMLYIGNNNTFYGINAENGNIVWRYSVPAGGIANQFDESSPCFNNGVIYVNCVDYGDDGLYGFNALTGALVLKERYLFNDATVVSPCIYNNSVYTAFDSDGSSGIFKYNLDSRNILSVYPIPTTATSSPTIFNGNIYIGSSDYLYSFADSVSNGQYRWRFQAASFLSSSSPTADSNNVYTGSSNGTVYAINDSTGMMQWEYQTVTVGVNVGASGSLTLANGVVYYGTITGLYALNAETGKLIWRNNEGGGIYSSPCVLDKNGNAYHSSISGIKN